MSKLNDVLKRMDEDTYVFSVPLLSNKNEEISFRPIKTKDQKKLIVEGQETASELQDFFVLIKLLDCCLIKNSIEIERMLVEDFFWLLINLRKKSLGEKIELFGNCLHCGGKKNPLVIDLDKDMKVNYLGKIKKNVIDVSPSLKFVLKFDTVGDMVNVLTEVEKEKKRKEDGELKECRYSNIELSLAAMIESVELDEEIIDLETLEDKMKLVSELSSFQLAKFTDFIKANPFGLKINKKYKCRKCKKFNEVDIDGFDILDFF